MTVSAAGGTAPYSGTGNFTVTAGTYNYTVTDANGCTAPASVTVNEPTTLTASATAGSILCNGGSTTVTVSATGGTAPLSYTFNGVINATGVFTDVPAGNGYTWSITDANSCGPLTGTIDVTQPDPLTVTTQPLNQTDCKENLAVFSVTVIGGVGTIHYQWQRNSGSGFSDIPGEIASQLNLYNIGVGAIRK